MSEEILENTSEEIADETAEESTYASSEEISSEEEQVIEENSKPRTKAGMMKAIYDQLNTLKKADLSDSYESIIGATLAEQDDDEEDEDDEEDDEEDEDDDDEGGVADGDGIEEDAEEHLSREEFDEQVLAPEGIRPMSQRGIDMWEEYNNQF